MIEAKIDELISALKENTAALAALRTGAAPSEVKKTETKKTEAKKEAAATPEGPTKDDFRIYAKQILDAEKQELLEELVKKYGVARITDVVGTDKAVAALADIKAAAATLSKKAPAGDLI